MRRAVLSLVVLGLFAVPQVVAQEAAEPEGPTHVYEAFYAVGFGDMAEWNRQYREYSIPILKALVEEGVIEGWDQYQHQTGGAEYNIRFAVRAYDWDAYDDFWSSYLERLQAVTPEQEWSASGRMVSGHQDAIWNIQHIAVPAEMEYTHLYSSTFHVNFADMPDWNEVWMETVAPLMEKAMAEGTLAGWVKLGHNTGGSHNSKILYFFNGWDNIDDFFGGLMGTIAAEHPETMASINEMVVAHDDAIWVPTPQEDPGEM